MFLRQKLIIYHWLHVVSYLASLKLKFVIAAAVVVAVGTDATVVVAAAATQWWSLFHGTEWNNGLNYGTEYFVKLKLAAYHCCTSYIGVTSSR